MQMAGALRELLASAPLKRRSHTGGQDWGRREAAEVEVEVTWIHALTIISPAWQCLREYKDRRE